jgi:hypothetical protein
MIIILADSWRAMNRCETVSTALFKGAQIPSDLFLCRRKKTETFRRVRCLMIETPLTMNHSKLVFSLSCFVAVTLASPLASAAPRGGGSSGGGHFSGGRSFSAGRPGMAASSGHSWSGRNWNGHNWSGRNWNGNWHHHVHNRVIFIGSFGFPSWWGWGWGPGWGWGYPYYGYGYPYGYYGYGYGYPYGYGGYGNYGYGNGYGYGYSSSGSGDQNSSPTRSRVAELQRRLSRAGYYHGSIDGVLGPQTRRAIRSYEQDHGYADAG